MAEYENQFGGYFTKEIEIHFKPFNFTVQWFWTKHFLFFCGR